MRQRKAKFGRRIGVAGPIALAVSAYALLALILGWIAGIDLLIRHPHSGTAMVPATSLSFIAVSMALVAALARQRPLTQALCAFVLVLVGITILTQLFGLSEFTELFVIHTDPDERMAPVTAIGFACAVLAINRLQAGSYLLVDSIAIFGLSGAIGILLTKLEVYTGLVEPRFFSGISLQTAVLFILMFLALWLTNLERHRAGKPDPAG